MHVFLKLYRIEAFLFADENFDVNKINLSHVILLC